MCYRIHSCGADLRSRCRGALLQDLEGQALEEHERGALTLEESDCFKRSRRDVVPLRLSFLFCFSNWVAPPPCVFFHYCGTDLRSGCRQTTLNTLMVGHSG